MDSFQIQSRRNGLRISVPAASARAVMPMYLSEDNRTIIGAAPKAPGVRTFTKEQLARARVASGEAMVIDSPAAQPDEKKTMDLA